MFRYTSKKDDMFSRFSSVIICSTLLDRLCMVCTQWDEHNMKMETTKKIYLDINTHKTYLTDTYERKCKCWKRIC